MSSRTKSRKRWGTAWSSPEGQARLYAENRAAWENVFLRSKFGARTEAELLALRDALIAHGAHPAFVRGADEFLKMKPDIPWRDLEGWSVEAIDARYPPELYSEDWHPNFPGDLVALYFTSEAKAVAAHEARASYAAKYKHPAPSLRPRPRIYVTGADDTNEEVSVETDAAALEIIQVLIAGQPLSRADFHGLGFQPT